MHVASIYRQLAGDLPESTHLAAPAQRIRRVTHEGNASFVIVDLRPPESAEWLLRGPSKPDGVDPPQGFTEVKYTVVR